MEISNNAHRVFDIEIYRYKSIRECRIEFGRLNVFIGGNGAGKSNLISAFSFLREIGRGNLQGVTAEAGGASRLIHFGRKHGGGDLHFSIRWRPELEYWPIYTCTLKSTDDDSLYPLQLGLELKGEGEAVKLERSDGPCKESMIAPERLQDFRIYHFHDTSRDSPMRQAATLHDDKFLREDASNLPAFLYRLSKSAPATFRLIEGIIRQVAPFFDRFELEPSRTNSDVIRLEWLEKGSDAYFNAAILSDGTLRFMALATLLLQPDPPPLILLDEPELGLHPAAIVVLAEMLRSASEKTQIIVATQSVTLVNQLEPDDLHVVERDDDGSSSFRRLKDADMSDWLEEYGLGDLWEKNVIGGRP